MNIYTTEGGIRANILGNTILQYTTLKMAVEFTQSCEGHTTLDRQVSPGNFNKNTQPVTQHKCLIKMANVITDVDTGVTMEYIQLNKNSKHRPMWIKYFANEIGRLAQGFGGRVEGTHKIFLLPYNNIPENKSKDVTYWPVLVDYRPKNMNCVSPASQLTATLSTPANTMGKSVHSLTS